MNRIIILTVALIIGFVIFGSQMVEKNDAICYNKNIYSKSLKIIENSEISSGGYVDIPLREPTLYSTYYFLEILKLLGIKHEKKEKTLEWLREMEKNNFQAYSDNNMYIRDIYFGVLSLKILGENPNNPIELKEQINHFQLSDGSYCYSLSKNGLNCQENNSRILATFYAINSLDSIGYAHCDNISKTKNWLITQWIEDDNFKDYKSITTIEKIVISSKILGVNLSELPKYEDRKIWLTEQENTIRYKLMDNSLNLFTLKSYYYLSNEFNMTNQNFRSEIYNHLINKQLPDGGYNAINSDYSESKGTFLALSILKDCNFSNINRNSIIDFVKSHNVSSGGFFPAYYSTTTIEDTYYALSVLEIFNSKPHYMRNLTNFIKYKTTLINQTKENELKKLYYLHGISKMVNNSDLDPDIINYSLEIFFKYYDYREQPSLEDMENLYYAVKLAKKSSYKTNENEIYKYINEMQNSDGGFGIENVSRTDMTFYAVSILYEIDRNPKNKTECIMWIKKNQNVDGGFRFRSGNLTFMYSDLYSTYLSVTTLELLDEKPQEIRNLCNWVRKLEHPDGGFILYRDIDDSQNKNANLKNTFWALKILYFFEGDDK